MKLPMSWKEMKFFLFDGCVVHLLAKTSEDGNYAHGLFLGSQETLTCRIQRYGTKER